MTVEDVLRSLKRHTAAILDTTDETYDVKLMREEPSTRPSAVIRTVGETLYSGPRHTTDLTQPFEIFVYPSVADADEPMVNSLKAQRVQQALADGFTIGVLPGKPMRVPVWDYSNTAWNAAATGPQIGFARMEALSTSSMVDPDDDSLFTVMVNFRLTWRKQADRRNNVGNTTTSITWDRTGTIR